MTDAAVVLRQLSVPSRAQLDTLEIFPELASTNTWLLQQTMPAPGRFRAVLAEHQTAGRGRNGKVWDSPPSSGLCLSIAGTFTSAPQKLSGLTLAAGAGVAEALIGIGARNVAIKWPNDIIAGEGKLGGLLIETCGNGVALSVVIGLGLNRRLPKTARDTLLLNGNVEASDLTQCMNAVPSLEDLAALMIVELMRTVSRFEREGLAAFRHTWRHRDWLKGKTVEAGEPTRRIRGIAKGIDDDGALLLHTGKGAERIVSGSVAVTRTDSA